MVLEIITTALSTLAAVGVTALVTVRATRRKANAEADTSLYESLKVAFDQYKQMTDLTIQNLELRIKELETDYKLCKEQLAEQIKSIINHEE